MFMKQLLCVVVIHLLILHQYKKDKSEALAPKKMPVRSLTPVTDPGSWLTGNKSTKKDSLFYTRFLLQSNQPYQHSTYLYW